MSYLQNFNINILSAQSAGSLHLACPVPVLCLFPLFSAGKRPPREMAISAAKARPKLLAALAARRFYNIV